jgi:hypothetical protein
MSELHTLPQTIDQVIAQMDQVIDRCIRERSRLGYFAMLYRDVTARVRDGIAAGRFENGPRMERLDVIFANRYLSALYEFWDGTTPAQSWLIAFNAAHQWSPIVMQHLLLGMNAHINLDLALAAVQVAPGNQLPALHRDFEEITILLGEMTLEMEERMERVSPWFRLIDRVGGRTNEQICGFAMQQARDLAWQTAEELAGLDTEQFAQKIVERDQIVATLGKVILSPVGIVLRLGLGAIRARETRPVLQVIQLLKL